MAYVWNEQGTMVSIPNNSPLPSGSRWATPEEVREHEEAEKIRTAAGIPAPKSPQQAQLEHEALLENIANRGGLATPQERVNLQTTAEESANVVTSDDAPAVAPVAVRPIGRGERAGDQYTQYEPLPGVAKVVTEQPGDVTQEAEPVKSKDADAAKAAPESARRDSDHADTREGSKGSTPAPAKAPGATEGYSTPKERAANSPTAKDKEK